MIGSVSKKLHSPSLKLCSAHIHTHGSSRAQTNGQGSILGIPVLCAENVRFAAVQLLCNVDAHVPCAGYVHLTAGDREEAGRFFRVALMLSRASLPIAAEGMGEKVCPSL